MHHGGVPSSVPSPGESFAEVRPDLVHLWAVCISRPELTPGTVKAGSGIIIQWRCPRGHEWAATPNSIRRTPVGSSGCRRCHGAKVVHNARAAKAGSKPLTELYPSLVTDWHPTKNLPLVPETTPGMHPDPVWWLCPDCGHEWSALVRARRATRGCPKCARARTVAAVRGHALKRSDSVAEHAVLSVQWSDKNTGIDPKDIPVSSGTRLWWQCDVCPEAWQASPYSRTRRTKVSVCPACLMQVVRPWNNLEEVHPQLATEWHPSKNGAMKASEVSAAHSGPVWWLGECGHEWRAVVIKRVSGHGCKSCPGRSRSATEIYFEYEIATILPVDVAARRIKITDSDTGDDTTVEADVVIPELRLALEYDGSYSHEGREENDRRKTALLEAAGWRVIRLRSAPLSLLREEDVPVAYLPTGFDLARAACQTIQGDYPDFEEKISNYLSRTGPAAAEEARMAIKQADARRARNSRRLAGLVTQPEDWSDDKLRQAYETMTLPQLAAASGYPLPLLRQVLVGIGVQIRSGRVRKSR